MASLCECCVATYCSCRLGVGRGGKSPSSLAVQEEEGPRSQLVGFQKQWEIWKNNERSCVVHSQCCFCNRALALGDVASERSVKRKLGKVYPVNDEQQAEQMEIMVEVGGSSDGEVRESLPKKQKDMQRLTSEEKELQRLTEALEAEREAVNALCMELEQERNAAAVAATESLAMITRLQEEKAAMQMETCHYKRIVEERAAYDEEAIALLNDILAMEEEEKQALAKEVEMYRSSASAADKKRFRSFENDHNASLRSSDDEFVTPPESSMKGGERNKLQSRNLINSFNTTEDVRPRRSPAPKSSYSPSRADDDDEEEEDVHERNGRATPSGRNEDSRYWKKYGHAASRDLRRASDRLDAGSSREVEDVKRSQRRNGQLLELDRRLQALEADRNNLKQSYGVQLPRDDDMVTLEEISQQLRHLQANNKADDMQDLSEASFVFSFKGFFSFKGLRNSLNSNLNRLACMFLKHTEAGVLNYSEHHVGLSHLLESSRKSPRVGISRAVKFDSPSTLTGLHAFHRQNLHWPTDARGRSDTAFNGWDC